MKLPCVEELYRPIMEYLSGYDKGRTIDEITYNMKEFYYIDGDFDKDNEDHISGKEYSKLRELVYQACQILKDHSLVIEKELNLYVISNLGDDLLDNVDIVDDDIVSCIPHYQPPAVVMVHKQQLTVDGYIQVVEVPEQTKEVQYWDATAGEFMKCPQYAEYIYPISFDDLASAADNDTRLLNMMSSGNYTFWDGTLMSVSDCMEGKEGAGDNFQLCSNGNKIVMATPQMMQTDRGKAQVSSVNGRRNTGGNENKKKRNRNPRNNNGTKIEKSYERGEYKTFYNKRVGMTDKEINEIIHEWRENMPNNYGDALNYIRNYLGTKSTELAFIIGRNVDYVRTYYAKQKEKRSYPDIDTACAICIAMNLPWDISNKLIKFAGYYVEADRPTYKVYEYLLQIYTCTPEQYSEVNEVLRKNEMTELISNEAITALNKRISREKDAE